MKDKDLVVDLWNDISIEFRDHEKMIRFMLDPSIEKQTKNLRSVELEMEKSA